jgi:hypothetical protein
MGEGIAQSGGIAATGGSGGEGGREEAPTDPLSYLQLLIQKQREATAVSAQEANARMAVLGQENTEGGAIVQAGEEAKAAAVEEGEVTQEASRKKGKALQKASALIGAGIAAALGISKALSEGGFFAGIPMAAAMAALFAVQIANITAAKTGGRITHGGVDVSDGGKLSGAGTGISDSIPAMLSNGEYVINAAQTKRYGAVLAAINSGKSQKEILERITNGSVGAFAAGGKVGSVAAEEARVTNIFANLLGSFFGVSKTGSAGSIGPNPGGVGVYGGFGGGRGGGRGRRPQVSSPQVGAHLPVVGSEHAAGMSSGSTYNTTHINVSGNVDQRSIEQIRKVISQSPKQVRGASEQGRRSKTGLQKSR